MKTSEAAYEVGTESKLKNTLFDLDEVFRRHREYIRVKYKITGLEMEIIQLVVLQGKKKMKEIGEHFGVKLSTLTSIIDKIERLRLVKRVNSKHDRRVVFLEVTNKGQKLYQDYGAQVRAMSQSLDEKMEESQFKALINGLKTISEFVSEDQTP